MSSLQPSHDAVHPPRIRAPWRAPTVTELPKLTQLTLQTGSTIPGDGSTGGSTVIP